MNVQAAVVREKSGPFVMEAVELDEPRADEVIVRVVSAGICHTDLFPREQAIPAPFPAVYGHEGAGVVEKTHRALQVAKQIDCGSVHVNGSTVQNEAQAPYGGMKNSGYGRFDSRAVIDEFTELKWITIEPLKQQYPV